LCQNQRLLPVPPPLITKSNAIPRRGAYGCLMVSELG